MDSLLVLPFFAGLPLAVLLPLIGLYLRLRDEWLATLGLAHLAATGVLAGMALKLPNIVGALLGAGLGSGTKQLVGKQGNSAWGLMILAGWSASLLVAANTALGEALAHALIDGQLYFAGRQELILAWTVTLIALFVMSWLAPRLIAARLLPEYERANRLPAWRWHLGFDLLTCVSIAASLTVCGLLASFALIFVPPWIAFRLAPDWRRAGRIAAGIGLIVYVVAFGLALMLDQPFGPLEAAVSLLVLAASGIVCRPASADFRERVGARRGAPDSASGPWP